MIRTNYGTILKDFEVTLSDPKVVNNKFVEATITILSNTLRKDFLKRFGLPLLDYDSLRLLYNWSKDIWKISAINYVGETCYTDDIIDTTGEFHYRMNRLVESETAFLSAEELLVAKRGKPEISYYEFKNLVSKAEDVFYKPDGKFYKIKASLVTDSGISITLGIFADSNEYNYFYNHQNPFTDNRPYYVNLLYDTKKDYMRILFGRNNSHNECCYNILDSDTKSYFKSLLTETITKNSGENIADEVLGKNRLYINDLKEKLAKAESEARLIKDTLESLGEIID